MICPEDFTAKKSEPLATKSCVTTVTTSIPITANFIGNAGYYIVPSGFSGRAAD